ncbi:unnamed protein product [Brassica rapa subsp. trilocularis]
MLITLIPKIQHSTMETNENFGRNQKKKTNSRDKTGSD